MECFVLFFNWLNCSVAELPKAEETPVRCDPSTRADAHPSAESARIAGRNIRSAASGKPPLPPQSKPRHSTLPHARKSHLVATTTTTTTMPPPLAPPPSPLVSTAGLQVALQHFKESARQDRERLAKSVPDFALIDLASAHPQTEANQTWASFSLPPQFRLLPVLFSLL